MLALDHLVLSCTALSDGVAAVEAALGVPVAGGGAHAHMGTHNRLLGLGPGLYLEVIAVDPAVPRPGWPRWFRLDQITGPPRLTNWVCRTDDLEGALRLAPAGLGIATPLSRGMYHWRFAIPATGTLPFDDLHPALIEWQGSAHPAAHLPDAGCRLTRLVVAHPEALALRLALGALSDSRVVIEAGEPAIHAEIATPQGARVLE